MCYSFISHSRDSLAVRAGDGERAGWREETLRAGEFGSGEKEERAMEERGGP